MIQTGCRQCLVGMSRTAFALIFLLSALLPNPQSGRAALPEPQKQPAGISKAAADSCDAKVAALEAYAQHPGKGNVTRFSEQEINSYLALDLSPKYGRSLKSLAFALYESDLQGSAVIDFDQLKGNSNKISARLLSGMFSGTHNLTVRGKVVTNQGKANFELEEARFDDSSLPNFLVSEIITAVGRKQKPPFDPMQPSQMPYHIQKVDFHKGYILVYQ